MLGLWPERAGVPGAIERLERRVDLRGDVDGRSGHRAEGRSRRSAAIETVIRNMRACRGIRDKLAALDRHSDERRESKACAGALT